MKHSLMNERLVPLKLDRKKEDVQLVNLYKESLALNNWKKGFVFRRIELEHFQLLSDQQHPRLTDIFRIIEAFNHDLEKHQGIAFEQASLKQTLAFKVHQILSIVLHIPEKTQQAKMINYLHGWAFSQMETFDLYPEVRAKALPYEAPEEGLTLSQHFNLPEQSTDTHTVAQDFNASLQSTLRANMNMTNNMNMTTNMSLMNKTQASQMMPMAMARQTSNQQSPLKTKEKDAYPFSSMEQFNLQKDLARFDRKQLMAVELNPTRGNSRQRQVVREYKELSNMLSTSQPHHAPSAVLRGVSEPKNSYVPFNDNEFSRSFYKINQQHRPVYHKQDQNNYIGIDGLDSKISRRIHKRVKEDLKESNFNQAFIQKHRLYTRNKQKIQEESMMRNAQSIVSYNEEKKSSAVKTEAGVSLIANQAKSEVQSLHFRSASRGPLLEEAANAQKIRSYREKAYKGMNMQGGVQLERGMDRLSLSVYKDQDGLPNIEKHRELSQAQVVFNRRYELDQLQETIENKQRFKDDGLEIPQGSLYNSLTYGLQEPQLRSLSTDCKILMRNPFAKDAKKKKKRKKRSKK